MLPGMSHFPLSALKTLLLSPSLSSTKRYILIKKSAVSIFSNSLQTFEKQVALTNFFVLSQNILFSAKSSHF